MNTETYPRIVFWEGFNEQARMERHDKGWVNVDVETSEGTFYNVFFSDPISLQQDLEAGLALGVPCFAEPGLIIVPEVTVEIMNKAVQYLWEQGFFSHLKPNAEG